MTLQPYDAVLLLSFGGPEAPEDVVPFLRNVTRGRGIPDARLEEVGEHYYHFGGRSPINDQNRALLAALKAELDARGIDIPVVWGNRNWAPYLTDTLRELADAGARRVLTIATSAYASYSGCRQYRENIADSLAILAAEGKHLDVDRVRTYYNHPGFVAGNVDAVVEAYERLDGDGEADGTAGAAPLVFVTHSIPEAMEAASGTEMGRGYREQHEEIAEIIARRASERLGWELTWQLAYCSRSGDPRTPWLEPDVGEVLAALHEAGQPSAVVAPIGFISDHMEVIYDLDTEAKETADGLGLRMERAATVGTHPAFVAGLVDLLLERAAAERGEDPERPAEGPTGAWPDVCTPDCCLARAGEPTGRAAACEAPVTVTA